MPTVGLPVQTILNRSFDSVNNRLNVSIGAANQTIDDDTAIYFGTSNDIAVVNRSTALSADAEITNQIVGTSDHQGVAANSLIVSNITANGDIGFYVNNGGNSLEAILIDTSALTIYLGFGTFTNVTFSAANSTNNTTFTVENTSNAAAASHSIVDIRVGGTTSTGDPQVRWTIPSGTSWYMGSDNSSSDRMTIGLGTVVGTTALLIFQAGTAVNDATINVLTPAATIGSSSTANMRAIDVNGATFTLSTTTQITSVWGFVNVRAATIAQSGGAVTVNAAAGVVSISLTASTDVTLTHSSAFRALTGGAAVNVSGLYVEAQTGGTTQNVQILMANGSTEPTAAPTDTAGIYAIDVGAASVLGFVEETAVVTPAGDFALTNKWIVRINGTTYAVGLTTILT